VNKLKFDVKFYIDKDGQEPIKDFINKLREKGETSKADKVRAKKILTYIHTLRRTGTRAGLPYMKHIDGDIWELRPFSDRIFLFFYKDNIFILVHHFLKKTRKTPKSEIEQAKRNMMDYKERSDNNGTWQ
jgi:phage-related protein